MIALLLAALALAPASAATPAAAAAVNCSDFSTQAAAQSYFLSIGGPLSDLEGLDGDSDGIACESNPCPCNYSTAPTVAQPPGPTVPPPSTASPALITRIIDGDTLDAQLADGRVLRIRVIGIDTPERGECGFDQATEYMESLALGRVVDLVADPTQDALDRYGRSLFYIDRDDGLDVGRQMVRAGWAETYVFGANYQRFESYLDAEEEADQGVWRLCDGDFGLNWADERRASAVAFMDRYFARLSNGQYRAAWGQLGRALRRDFRPYGAWRAGYRRTVSVTLVEGRARLSGGRAVVAVRIRARDRDACNGRVVGQIFAGNWVLAPRNGSWVAVKARLRKTGGGKVRLSKNDCAAPTPRSPPTPPPTNCQGYSPCLPPGADVDCAGGNGNGPRYVNGPVAVNGSDPYGLDSDGDGLGCED